MPGATTPDQKTMRTTLRKSNPEVARLTFFVPICYWKGKICTRKNELILDFVDMDSCKFHTPLIFSQAFK